jgi:hypothetical protein
MAIQHYPRRYTEPVMFVMQHLRDGRALRAWGLRWAMAAALALALLPTLSRALAAPASHLAVCTADGVVWLADEASQTAEAATLPLDCAMCLLAASGLAPPPAGPRPGHGAAQAGPAADGAWAPVRSAPPWPRAQPRAPPVPA